MLLSDTERACRIGRRACRRHQHRRSGLLQRRRTALAVDIGPDDDGHVRETGGRDGRVPLGSSKRWLKRRESSRAVALSPGSMSCAKYCAQQQNTLQPQTGQLMMSLPNPQSDIEQNGIKAVRRRARPPVQFLTRVWTQRRLLPMRGPFPRGGCAASQSCRTETFTY